MKNIKYCLLVGALLTMNALATKGQTSIGTPLNTNNGPGGFTEVFSSVSVGDTLIIGGIFDHMEYKSPTTMTDTIIPANNIAWYDGANWHPMHLADSNGFSDQVNALALYKDSILYCAGRFTFAGKDTANYIAKLNIKSIKSTQFESVKNLKVNNFIWALIMDTTHGDSMLYVGGSFDTVGRSSTYPGVAGYHVNHPAWSPLGNGLKGGDQFSNVMSLVFYHDSLFAGGGFDSTGNTVIQKIAKWNNTTWLQVGSKIDTATYDQVRTMSVFKNSLYIGGIFNFGPIHGVAQLNGNSWEQMGSGVDSNAWIYCMTAFSPDSLYIAGEFTVKDSDFQKLAIWNATTWLYSGNSDTVDYVTMLCAYSDPELCFGTIPANSNDSAHVYLIAKHNVITGIPSLMNSSSSNIYPNPNTGNFTISTHSFAIESILTIYNELGQIIYSCKLLNKNQPVSLPNEPSGMYFYNITGADNSIASRGKFIIL